MALNPSNISNLEQLTLKGLITFTLHAGKAVIVFIAICNL